MTLQSSIQIYDGLSPAFRSMQNAMSIVISSFEAMQDLSSNAIDTSSLRAAQDELANVGATFQVVEEQIRRADDQQRKLNDDIRNGGAEADKLSSKIKQFVGAYAGLAGLRKAKSWLQDSLDLSNTQMNAERQLRTVLGNTMSGFAMEIVPDIAVPESKMATVTPDRNMAAITPQVNTNPAEQAFETIKATAADIQGYTLYGDEALIGGAAELATYINDADAIQQMMGTLADYAAGMSGGGEVSTQQMVDYATQLGKALDGTYDGLKKKGFELTEAQQKIIEYGTDMEKALVLDDAIAQSWAGLAEQMANTPEGQIIQLSNAFGDIREEVGERLYPHVLRFLDVLQSNMPTITTAIMGFSDAAGKVIVVISGIVNAAMAVYSVFAENWSWIGPIILGIVTALGIYNGILLANTIIQGISNALKTVAAIAAVAHGKALAADAAATTGMTTAQMTLNAALLACPITWIVIALIALIVIIYAVVAAINKFAGTSYSATGVVMGVFFTMGAHIYNNTIVPLQNGFASFVNFFANLFNDPVAAVKVLFYDMAQTVLGYILNIARGIENLINAIPGMEVDITGGLSNVYSGLQDAAQQVKDESGWVEVVGRLEYKDYREAAMRGYAFGEDLPNKVGGYFDSGSLDEFAYNDALSGIAGMSEDISGIGGDTGAIRDSVEVTNEDLKYLRDLAEQEVVNRFTTAEIRTEVTNHNYINNDMDVDGFVSRFADGVEDAMYVMAEGVHP